jgi:valyl-tRNA synthetase
MGLEGRYNYREAEPKLQERWAALRIYEYDPRATGPVFSVDTPPPTVSGQIHIGHVYSYTQADIAIRFRRMRGATVFYPFGFDDNGLPTERFTELSRGITARDVGRERFIQACLELSAQMEERFERFWKRLGLSVDWRLRYSTIDDRSRRIAQRGFLDLHARGQVERREAPTLWCPECRTAVAQAEVEDKAGVPATFITLAFPTTDGRAIRIATTRPELLAACVAIFVHPDDPRYADLVGATAITPLFGQSVPILTDRDAQPEKGTGAVMCCTFGDVTDVRWWYTHHLPLRIAIGRDGRMTETAGPYAGMPIRKARAKILEDLEAEGRILDRRETTHIVGVHERCGTAIEYLVAGQWFISVLAHKDRLLEAGRQIAWHPEYMHARYESWVRGLTWDWNISRQRYYGVPFPLWYCGDCGGVILAGRDSLPVDPTTTAPPGPCPACGSMAYRPETDVMDTWATSSLTPQICATLAEDLGLDEATFMDRLSPMSLRPNAHDNIRTWDFYTIVQSLFHTGTIPWREVMIAGHAQDPAGKKLSKSKLKTADDPTATIEQYSADAVRYWTAGVRTGSDTTVSEEAFRQGNRLVTKLWNAARFVLMHGGDDHHGVVMTQGTPASMKTPDRSRRVPAIRPQSEALFTAAELTVTDRWMLGRLGRTVERATTALESYELSTARAAIERFFWSDFCDTYLELVKYRLTKTPDGDGDWTESGRAGAISTTRGALLAVLKLLAPYLPHVTEELYLQGFARDDGAASIHLARWPDPSDYPHDPEAEEAGETMLAVVEAVRRWKAERNLSVGTPLGSLTITCPPEQAALLREMSLDLRSISRAACIIVETGDAVAVEIEEVPPQT